MPWKTSAWNVNACLRRHQTDCVSSSRNCLPVSLASRPRALFTLPLARRLPRLSARIVFFLQGAAPSLQASEARADSPPPPTRALRQITSSRPPPTDDRLANLNNTPQPGHLVEPPKSDVAAKSLPFTSSHTFHLKPRARKLFKMSGEAWLYLLAVLINAVNLFLQVFFTIMYSDLEWYASICLSSPPCFFAVLAFPLCAPRAREHRGRGSHERHRALLTRLYLATTSIPSICATA